MTPRLEILQLLQVLPAPILLVKPLHMLSLLDPQLILVNLLLAALQITYRTAIMNRNSGLGKTMSST